MCTPSTSASACMYMVSTRWRSRSGSLWSSYGQTRTSISCTISISSSFSFSFSFSFFLSLMWLLLTHSKSNDTCWLCLCMWFSRFSLTVRLTHGETDDTMRIRITRHLLSITIRDDFQHIRSSARVTITCRGRARNSRRMICRLIFLCLCFCFSVCLCVRLGVFSLMFPLIHLFQILVTRLQCDGG